MSDIQTTPASQDDQTSTPDTMTTGKTTTASDVQHVLEFTELQKSLQMYPYNVQSNTLERWRATITNPKLFGAYLIDPHHKPEDNRCIHLQGVKIAYQLLQADPEAKIILISMFTKDGFLKAEASRNDLETTAMVKWLFANKQCVYFDLLDINADVLNNAFGKEQSPEELEALQNSVEFYAEYTEDIKNGMRKIITNPALHGLTIINSCYRNDEHTYLQDFGGIQVAYDLLQKNPQKKILVIALMGIDTMKWIIQKRQGNGEKMVMLNRLLANPQCRFLEDPMANPADLNTLFDDSDLRTDEDQQTMFEAEKKISTYHIAVIRHSLEGYKVKDPYHPANNNEKGYVAHAFELTQKYFPGLDTVEKMLDYVLHVKIDIPEVMQGKRIEGVYVDIDGTLIDYVPIGSPLEGTQQLRPQVVELLKKYEAEGKKIIIWTGGDASMKETYLRSLGIIRPVVSKYDYAGATAEIVVDDTDRGAFVLQSKIMPETYIDTRNMH